MDMTQIHPHRSDLRRRADRLIAALDTAPAPQTLPDIMRAARALMVIDRLLSQLWATAPAKSGRHPVNTVAPDAPPDALSPDDTTLATVRPATPPLNRHQRRQQAAQDRSARPDSAPLPRRETG